MRSVQETEYTIVLLMSDDQLFVNSFKQNVVLPGTVALYAMLKSDTPTLIRMNSHSVLIWDLRACSGHDYALLEWVRQRSERCPVVVCVNDECDANMDQLNRMGLNMIVDMSQVDGWRNLESLLQLLLNPQQKEREGQHVLASHSLAG